MLRQIRRMIERVLRTRQSTLSYWWQDSCPVSGNLCDMARDCKRVGYCLYK